MGWRKDSIKYKKNEVFLDIVEQASLPAPFLHMVIAWGVAWPGLDDMPLPEMVM